MTGVPPKRFVVDQQTSAGRKAKAVSVRIWLMRRTLSLNWTPRLRLAPRRPMKRPVATRTGMIGTKTSPSVREIFWAIDICAYASALLLLAPARPVPATKASNTLSTKPVPRMIWYWAAAKNWPLTPSIFSMAFSLSFDLSLMIRRRRVAQCSALRTLSRPPTYFQMSLATRSSFGRSL